MYCIYAASINKLSKHVNTDFTLLKIPTIVLYKHSIVQLQVLYLPTKCTILATLLTYRIFVNMAVVHASVQNQPLEYSTETQILTVHDNHYSRNFDPVLEVIQGRKFNKITKYA